MEPIAVSTDEAGHILGVSRPSIYNMVNRGELEKIKIGSRALITMRSLKRRAAELLGEEMAPSSPKDDLADRFFRAVQQPHTCNTFLGGVMGGKSRRTP